MTHERISVLGAGSWGGSVARVLANNGHDVSLWEFDPAAAERLAKTRTLSFLPELILPDSIHVTSSLREAVQGCRWIVSGTPSHFVRSTWKAVSACGAPLKGVRAVSISKGLEEKTLLRMSQVIASESSLSPESILTLSGPSHAEEVCRDIPTAVVVTGTSAENIEAAHELFNAERFRVYTNDDPIGVELAGSLKNIFAIACGICDGLGLGDNTKCALLTRALKEMARLGMKEGAKLVTFYGLAGLGDLMVTALSRHSRNRAIGEKIGLGKTLQEALGEMVMVAEGVRTSAAAYALTRRHELDLPIISELYHVLHEGKSAKESMHDLLIRRTHGEMEGLL